MMFGLPPVTSMCIDQLPELGPVIVVFKVGEFMHQNVVDTRPWGFDQVWVQMISPDGEQLPH